MVRSGYMRKKSRQSWKKKKLEDECYIFLTNDAYTGRAYFGVYNELSSERSLKQDRRWRSEIGEQVLLLVLIFSIIRFVFRLFGFWELVFL